MCEKLLNKTAKVNCNMTPRKQIIETLEIKKPFGRVPHFELVFYLTMEAFGKVHPLHRNFQQWDQMSEHEKQLHRRDMAEVYVATAQKYSHSAIFYQNHFIWDSKQDLNEALKNLEEIRKVSGEQYFLMMHGDATYEIPQGDKIAEFSNLIADNPQKLKDDALKKVDLVLSNAQFLQKSELLDGFALCSDYCFNSGPFLSPSMFDDFITPYLKELIAGYRELGFYTIKHTDGNIMPILNNLVDANPHALHSLDPQGGVDIAEIKKLVGNTICLIGGVNCGLMSTGSDEEIVKSAMYALKHGMPGGGYVFSTSNCIYTGMPLRSYELILDIWQKEGNYMPDSSTDINNREFVV